MRILPIEGNPAQVQMSSMDIAIAGVGGIGKHILDALLKTPNAIRALSTRVSPSPQYCLLIKRLETIWKDWG